MSPKLLNLSIKCKPKVISILGGLLSVRRALSSNRYQEKDSMHREGWWALQLWLSKALMSCVLQWPQAPRRRLYTSYGAPCRLPSSEAGQPGPRLCSAVPRSCPSHSYLPAGCRGSTSPLADALLPSPSLSLGLSCWR